MTKKIKITIDDLYAAGFGDEPYTGDMSRNPKTFIGAYFSISQLTCTQQDIEGLDLEMDDPARVHVEFGEVCVVYGNDMDCLIGPFKMDSKEGQAILREAITALKK